MGLNHEQQHQELALTDLKHAFFSNPLHPSYATGPLSEDKDSAIPKLDWHTFDGGVIEIGHPLSAADPLEFCFDNETPRHKVYLQPFQIANREVTCGEFLEFMADDAYARPEFWLSAGWETVKSAGWQAPLYWQRDASDETGWRSSRSKVGLDFPRYSMCRCVTSASSRPTPLHAGGVADFRRKRNGSAWRANRRRTEIYSIQ